MRRNFLLLAVALSLTIASFFYFRSPAPTALTNDAPPAAYAAVNALPAFFASLPRPSFFPGLAPVPAPAPAALAIREASGGALFEALFPAARLAEVGEAEIVAAAAERFARPYPAETNAHHGGHKEEEIVARMGILKALGQRHFRHSGAAFFERTVRNSREAFPVRRQALANLLPLMAASPETVREKILKDLPPRLVALAASSERALLESQFGPLGKFRKISADATAPSLNKWDALPCPTAEEFVTLTQPLGWTGTDPYVCDLSPLGKFGRVLALLGKLETAGGDSLVEKNLKSPYEFLRQRSKKMMFDFTQSDSVAFNKVLQAEIHIGGIFFEYAPLRALSVLIHEARHSDHTEEMGHTICLQGDIPRTSGGCDDRLTDTEKAGAYTYGAYFSLALSETAGLSEADREYLRSEALSDTLRRFNVLETHLAHFQDAVVTLGESGELNVLHPFARQAIRPAGVPAGERFQHISFDDRSGGVYLFSSQRRARTWAWGRTATEFQPDQVPVGLGMVKAAKARLPYQEYAYNLFLDDSGTLRYVDFDSRKGAYELLEYPLKPDFRVREFALAAFQYTYFLSEEGKLFHVRRWGNQTPFVPVLEAESSFVSLTGGVIRDSLYLVKDDGRLYRQELVEKQPDPNSGWQDSDGAEPEYIPTLHASSFLAPTRVRTYQEGVSLRGVLGKDGSVWIRAFGDASTPVRVTREGERVKAFTIMKLLEVHGRLAKARRSPVEALAAFASACGTRDTVTDPWFQRGVGLRDGQLIFEGDDGACLAAALPKDAKGAVQAFSFRAGAFGEIPQPSAFFAPVGLELKFSDGREAVVRPYAGY